MQAFMKRFPLPVDEAERATLVDGLELMQLPIPSPLLEAELHRIATSGALGAHAVATMLNVLDVTTQRTLRTRVRQPSAQRWLTTAEVFEGMPSELPKKLSMCQYAVSSGEMTCINMAKEHSKQPGDGRGTLISDPATTQSLAGINPEFGEAMQALMPAMSPEWLQANPGPASLLSLVVDPEIIYVGVPLRLHGRVVVTLCMLLQGVAEASVAHKQALEAQAAPVLVAFKQLLTERPQAA